MSSETERVRELYDELSGRYDRAIRIPERLLFGDGRGWACSRARSEVLEVAVGTGRNLSFYPEDVHLTGIDLSPAMLKFAQERADSLGMDADLRVGDAHSLPFSDECFDTVIFTLALCTIPDDRKAVREAWRVLRPGGRLLLLEHVRSPNLAVRLIQRILAPFTMHFQADHLLRDPLDYLLGEGFEVEHLERSKGGIVERVVARKSS